MNHLYIKCFGYSYILSELKKMIVKKNSEDRVDRYGLLTKSVLIPNQFNEVYKAISHCKFVEYNLYIINTNNHDVDVSVFVTNKQNVELVDTIEAKASISKNDTFILSGRLLSTLEKIILYTTYENIVVRIEGFEDRKG